jgi:hypothetical protein
MKYHLIKSFSNIKSEDIIIKVILLAGIILSVWQYLFNRSLWLDEASLALNILDKDFIDLLKPLDYKQVAPILFLLIEKTFSTLNPGSEYGLRLFPLISYWISLYFFYQVLKIVFRNSYTHILALSLFVFNSILIFYSSEVKQYMTDVMVLTTMYYFLLKNYRNPVNRYLLLGILGLTAIFLSNISPIILASCGFYFLCEYIFLKKNELIKAGLTSFAWLIAFGIYYYIFIHEHPTRNSMITYWSNANAFLPLNPSNPNFFKFVSAKSVMLSKFILHFNLIKFQFPILIILAILSAIIRKKTLLIALLIFPVFLHLLFSAFKLYPFDNRLILYLYPVIIIVIALLLDHLIEFSTLLFKIRKMTILAILIPLVLFFLLLKKEFPIQKQEIKKSIQYIEENTRKHEKIYIYGNAKRAYAYYERINYVNFSDRIIIGGSYRSKGDAFFDEILKLNGLNWVLMSQIQPKEEIYVGEQLRLRGVHAIDSIKTIGSSATLYDFN